MNDENESSFMMIFKLISGNPKLTAAVVSLCVLGIIIYISSSDSNISDSNSGEETSESGVGESSTRENATCSTVSGNCPDGYLYKIDSADIECVGTTCDVGISGTDLNTCCDPWTCAISVSDRELYNIQVGSNPISENTISYTDIGGATVSCKEGAQRTGGDTEPSIERCVNNNGNAILTGCESEPVAVNCEGTWSAFSECSRDCGEGEKTRTYTITTQKVGSGQDCEASSGDVETQRCNTGDCDTCSSYNCPDNYILRPSPGEISCEKPACGTDDRDICCEQGCSAPDTMPTGYAGSLPAALPVGNNAEITESTGSTVQCASNYHGIPQYNCSTTGEAYTLSGCNPDECTKPTDTTGYINLPTTLPFVSGTGTFTGASCASNYHPLSEGIRYTCNTAGGAYTLSGCDPDVCIPPSDITGYNITDEQNLEKHNFSVNVTCAPGYGSDTATDAQAVACGSDGESYTLTGCDKTGFCSGNNDPSNDVTCDSGYTLKSDSAERIGRNTASCCDKTGFCSGNNDPSNDVTCDSGYNDKPGKNTIVGNTLETCCDQIISPPEAQTSGTQDTDLPICDAIKLTDKVASVARDEIIEDITLEECITDCRDNDNCNSFSYKANTSNCYIYYQSNIRHQFNSQYDYYPVKCQP